MSRIRVLLQLVRPYRWRLLLALVLTLLYNGFSLTPPLLMRYLMDHVVIAQQWKILGLVVGLVAFVPIWNAAFAMMNRLVIASLGQRLVVDLRSGLYRNVLNLSMRFHGEMGAGPITNRLMGDSGVVQRMVTGETLGIVSSAFALILYAVAAFWLNWQLALVMLLMVALYVVNYRIFAMRIRRANLDLREILDGVTGQLQERIAGVRLVKIYCREHDETNAFLASTERALQFGMRSQMLSVSLTTSAHLISNIGSTVIWCGAAWFVLNGDMTYGSMLALTSYVAGATTPAVNLTMVAGTIIESTASLDRILEIMRQHPDVKDAPDAGELPETITGDIKLENIFFAYKPEEPLFQGLNLHLPAGKMTALVGHTGCGKTSVTSLLMRLWDVQGGAVTVDGHDVRALTARSLRRHIGVVPQEPVVFEGTIHENIAYGNPDAAREAVEEAARAAQIHDYIAKLPDGYDSYLGKDGIKLSVGQKQRISIARAILSKPAVLVLDEATSSLDTESELAIQEALRTVLKHRTSVVVAHRLSTIVEADQIVVMDQGKVIEIGTHEELMRKEGGHYRRLYDELKGQQPGEVIA